MSSIIRQDALSVKQWKHELKRYWFYEWKIRAQKLKLFRDYDNWCEANDQTLKDSWLETRQEEREEIEYAAANGMDSIEWCWECKYGDCRRHSACQDCKIGNCTWCY